MKKTAHIVAQTLLMIACSDTVDSVDPSEETPFDSTQGSGVPIDSNQEVDTATDMRADSDSATLRTDVSTDTDTHEIADFDGGADMNPQTDTGGNPDFVGWGLLLGRVTALSDSMPGVTSCDAAHPISGVTVIASKHEGDFEDSTITDDDGRFNINLPHGMYTVRATGPRVDYVEEDLFIMVKESTNLDIAAYCDTAK